MESSGSEFKLSKKILDVTSLLDLKAELLKKQKSLNYAKLNHTDEFVKKRRFKLKEDIVKESQKHLPQNLQHDEDDNETKLAFEKSRLALEAKSRLYEDIMSEKRNLRDDESENYLVDFHKKVIESDKSCTTPAASSKGPNHNQIDTAAFCEKSFCSLEEKMKGVQNPVLHNEEASPEKTEFTHYQHVQFNEIRDHGVGYFAFSKDEKKRKEQMDMLNELHSQTNIKRRCHNVALEKRKSSLEARLAKICNRRNIDKNVISGYTSILDSNASTPSANETTFDNLSSIPLPEDNEVTKVTKQVRPWDVGKGYGNTSGQEMQWAGVGQDDEWVERKRAERIQEFQPPEKYS